jgi:hypothetical protein
MKTLQQKNTAHVECKNKSDTSNNSGNWNRLIVIQKISQQHASEPHGTTESSHIGHCARAAESADVKHKRCIMGYNITRVIYCSHRIAAKFYTLRTWFVSGI